VRQLLSQLQTAPLKPKPGLNGPPADPIGSVCARPISEQTLTTESAKKEIAKSREVIVVLRLTNMDLANATQPTTSCDPRRQTSSEFYETRTTPGPRYRTMADPW
jgi:hypothetical protein